MIRLAVLISGSGTTAQSIIRAWKKGALGTIELIIIIGSRPDAGGLAKAKAEGVATTVVCPADYASQTDFGTALLKTLRDYTIDLVSQNGWLPLTPQEVTTVYKGKIINQHPGPLDPGHADFGGKGMFGRRVTAARIAYAWMVGHDYWTEGATHHVTEEFDKGNIIRTARLAFPKLSKRPTFAELQKNPNPLVEATNRVVADLLPLEHQNVVATLAEYGKNGKFPVFQRNAPLVNVEDKPLLDQAKRLAIKLFPTG